jgi:hypothetical protein
MLLKRTGICAGLVVVAAVACLPVFSARAGAISQPQSSCARSTERLKQLAMIENVEEGSFQCLGVALEGGSVKALHVETHHFANRERHPDTEQVKVEDFSRDVIESSRGAVLDGVPGHDAIVLRGRFTEPSGRLDLVTSYLYNGFTSEYHSCRIALDRSPAAGWRLVDRLDQPISHIVVRTRQMPLIGMFGIANLEGACA